MPNKNVILSKARNNKKDEFYTQLPDIENELKHYKDHFKGKVIYCNCDDPVNSNFYKYFAKQFGFLGLKKLITTHYDYNEQKPTYKLELTSDNFKNPKNTPLKGNGDFRSAECIEILKEADIVVTNPPFSLFREYVAQLIEYEKKFIIIGSQQYIATVNLFPLFKKNEIWVGLSASSGIKFASPYKKIGIQSQMKSKLIIIKDAMWFTNLDHNLRHEPLILYKTYNEQDYPKYVNYNGINVDKTKDIPKDYDGIMGVPLSFMTKYNPDQFEIIGLSMVGLCNFINNKKITVLKNGIETNKSHIASWVLMKWNKNRDKYPGYKDYYSGELYTQPYKRIFIKRK